MCVTFFKHLPDVVLNSLSVDLLLRCLCLRVIPQLIEAALSGIVNDIRQRPQTTGPDGRLVMPLGLSHETVR